MANQHTDSKKLLEVALSSRTSLPHRGITWHWKIIFAFENRPPGCQLLQNFLVDVRCVFWAPELDDDVQVALISQLPNEFPIKVMGSYGRHYNEGSTFDVQSIVATDILSAY